VSGLRAAGGYRFVGRICTDNALVLTGLATFQVVGYTKAISNGVVGNEAMRPASVGRVTVAESPECNDLTQLLSFWCIFGAGQGRLGTRKRNRSNDLDLICVHLEGRRSIQLSYGRTSRVDSKSFIAKKSTILERLPSADRADAL